MASTHSYFQPHRPEEIQRLGEVTAESFALAPGTYEPWFAYAGAENLRAWRDGDEIVGGLVLVPMGQFFGGRSVRLCGFGGVSMLPHMRGGGAGTRMMTEALRELRGAGWPLAGLYPATQPLYRRVGFEQAGLRVETRGPITGLPRSDRTLPMRPFHPDDLPAVKALYTDVARHRTGWLDRGPYVWHRVQNPGRHIANGYIVGAPGQVDGYVFLVRLNKPSLDHDVMVTDLVARTPAGWRRLLTALRDHASLAGDVIWYGGADDVRLHLLEEQRLIPRVHDTWMLRILDVPRALGDRGYPDGVQGSLHLDITDPMFPENAGRFVIEVSGGEARVQRGGEGHLRCDVRALATIYSGFRTARALAAIGHLEASADALDTAGTLFAGPPPAMPDMY